MDFIGRDVMDISKFNGWIVNIFMMKGNEFLT